MRLRILRGVFEFPGQLGHQTFSISCGVQMTGEQSVPPFSGHQLVCSEYDVRAGMRRQIANNRGLKINRCHASSILPSEQSFIPSSAGDKQVTVRANSQAA
jgi:hypothetical protein